MGQELEEEGEGTVWQPFELLDAHPEEARFDFDLVSRAFRRTKLEDLAVFVHDVPFAPFGEGLGL